MNDNNNGMIEYEQIGSGALGGVTSAPSVPQNEHMSIPFMMSGPPSSIVAQSGPVSSTNSSGLPPSGHRPRSGSAREQAVHAVDYYNSNVLRARVGAGLSGPRSSVNERHLNSNNKTYVTGGPISQKNNSRIYLNPDNLYRSNSSLELLHDHSNSTSEALPIINGGNLRREYGSHGSIDVISSPSSATTSESFFAMLQDYRPAVLGVIGTDQRSPGPAEYLKGKVLETALKTNLGPNASSSQSNSEDQNQGDRPSSPKLRAKFQKLWTPSNSDSRRQTNRIQTILIDDCSGPPSQATSLLVGVTPSNNSIVPNHSQIMSSPDIEERQRRRAFAHYDCQSLTANLGYAAKLRGLLLARRRNTTTGASAASLMGTRSSTPDAESGDEDNGDGQSNDLLESCPFFRNEIGNEEEREVCLTRALPSKATGQRRAVHRPALACGVSILECPINETIWKQTTCPFQKNQRPIESVDHGARYYRQYFQSQEHHNWFGMDEQLGPVAISIKREKLPELVDSTHANRFQFRMIVRTSELLTLRGSVLEDSIPNTRGQGKPVTTKEVLEYVTPEIQINCLRLGVNSPQCEQQLIKLDEQGLTNKYKIGILYCRAGQSSEEDMYNNEEAGPAFMEFLETIGKRVRLKGFEHYKAGLDNKTDSTGTHSLYANFQDCEIMFHVSTMLPFTPNNRQQLLRKRHIGNDIVTIVFQEPGALPFTPKNIRSQFQHVFIVVRAVNPCSENTYYRVAVSRSKEVPIFGPPLTPGAKFPRGKTFAEFLLAKVINAENAAHRSEKFATMATRTRQEYLKDLATNYCTTTVVDTGPKFSIFPSKKKEKPKLRFSGDSTQRGAFCWQVVLQDSGQSTAVDCFLGISTETFVLIEECSRQIVFVTPCKSILGWSTNGNSLRIYHHQGECVTLNMRDSGERDEQLEVIERLRSVTLGCGALELNLRRNPMGQLGFHVQPDGVVTQVETSGQAWVAGLRQGFRLVEICKVAVATLSHDQMVDLLKTSAQVTVTVIESFADFSPRRGCLLPNCRFNSFAYENDYESAENNKNSKKSSANAQLQQPVVNHRRRYERNFSPPRSSNSSGYGTGSSSRSFSIPNEHGRQAVDMGTLTSSSSGHSSNDDRWYDVLESVDLQTSNNQIQNPQQHVHHNHNNEHSKLAPSASLPVTSNGNPRPLSIHDPTKLSTAISEHFVRSNNVESLATKQSSRKSEHNELNLIVNEQIYNKSIGSTDDELQTDFSPQLKRSATTTSIPKIISANSGNISSSSSSSRNNSPRPLSEALSASAAAKLRPGVTSRNQAFLLQRNSTTGNTLQEDLMKLINPDSDEIFAQCNGTKTLKNPKTDEIFLKNKSRSREGINIPQQIATDLRKNDGAKGTEGEKPEVIYTTARPATVVVPNKNNEGKNSATDNLLFISEAGRYQQNGTASTSRKFDGQMTSQPLPLLPDTNDMDWSSLVDTATRAMMMQFTEETKHILKQENVPLNLQNSSIDLQHSQHEPQSLNIQNTASLSQYPLTPSNSLPELQTHLSQLEDRILRETRRRKSLEHAVRRLTEENRRLQDESQAAVQQLRRFTEWFFQTIDRQS